MHFPDFVAAATNAGFSASPSVVCPVVEPGDLIIVTYAWTGGVGVNFAVPLGFTSIASVYSAAGGNAPLHMAASYRVADGSEDGSTFAISLAGARYFGASVVVYRGAAGLSSGGISTNAGSPVSAGSLNAGAGLLLRIFGTHSFYNGGYGISFSGGPGTERADANSSDAGCAVYEQGAHPSYGATGSASASATNASSSAGLSVVLHPKAHRHQMII